MHEDVLPHPMDPQGHRVIHYIVFLGHVFKHLVNCKERGVRMRCDRLKIGPVETRREKLFSPWGGLAPC